jgi:hypothetical protein
MNKETLPTTERFEFDPAYWLDSPVNTRTRSDGDWLRIFTLLGNVALQGAGIRSKQGTARRPYWRGNGYLSADDVHELERYLAFLRQYYGIEDGATVFPKHESELEGSEDEEAPRAA